MILPNCPPKRFYNQYSYWQFLRMPTFPYTLRHWVLSNVHLYHFDRQKSDFIFISFARLNILLYAYWWPVLLFLELFMSFEFLENWFFIFLLICKNLCRKLISYHMNCSFPLQSVDGFSLTSLRLLLLFCHE